MLLDPAQGRNLNGWQRIWIFGSVIWAALIFIIAVMNNALETFAFLTWASIPPGIFLILEYGIAWIRRGFHKKAFSV